MAKPKKPKARGPKPRTSKPKAKPKRPSPGNTDHLDASTFDASKPLENTRHERICQLLAHRGLSQGQAYILAGFTVANADTAQTCAARLLGNVRVAGRLTFLQAEAAAMAIDGAAMSKADVLNEIWEQHQRNIGRRKVCRSVLLTGMTEPIDVEMAVYDSKAASQTLALLSDEYGLGQGASGARGEGGDTIDARAKLEDPTIQQDLENLSKVRGMVLIESGLAEAPPAPAKKAPLDPVQAAARLKKLAEG